MANAITADPPAHGEHLCRTPAETRQLAIRIAEGMTQPGVIALDGPLGAGKTEFVKGLAAGLGCAGEPSSPTFAIAHEYPGGRLAFFHFDFYRLESPDEVTTSGVEECFGEGLVAIEWAHKFPWVLPSGALHVSISILKDDTRQICVR